MLLQSRSVWHSAFGARGEWRGARLRPVVKTPGGYVGQAALARAQRPRTFFPVRGRPSYRVKQAAPANCTARCFVSRSVRIIHFAPRDKPCVGTVRGSRLLKKICGHIRAEKNSARSGGYHPKRLARRSLPESKRRGEVWLPSRRLGRQTPNSGRQTPNAE
jgi:hypothetical protein